MTQLKFIYLWRGLIYWKHTVRRRGENGAKRPLLPLSGKWPIISWRCHCCRNDQARYLVCVINCHPFPSL